MNSQIYEFLYEVDFFSTKPFLTANKKRYISTNVSKIFSLIFYIIFTFLIVEQAQIFFDRSSFNITETFTRPSNTVIKMNRNSEMLGFQFSNLTLQKNIHQYFRPQIQYFSIDRYKQELHILKKIDLEQCTLEHFEGLKNDTFTENRLDLAICYPLNYQAEMILNDKQETGMQFVLDLCYNSTNCTDLRNKDNRESFTNLYQESQFINFYQYQNDFFLQDNKQPIQSIFSSYYLNVNIESDFYVQQQLYPTNFILDQDKSLFGNQYQKYFQNISNTLGVYFNKIDQKQIPISRKKSQQQFNYLCRIQYYCNSKQKSISIIYLKFQNIVIWIIGTLQLIILFMQFVVQTYNDKVYFLNLEKLISGNKNQFQFCDFWNGFSLENKIDQKAIEQINRQIDIKAQVKTGQYQKLTLNMIFSKKMKFVIEILRIPPKNLNDLLNKFKKFIQNNTELISTQILNSQHRSFENMKKKHVLNTVLGFKKKKPKNLQNQQDQRISMFRQNNQNQQIQIDQQNEQQQIDQQQIEKSKIIKKQLIQDQVKYQFFIQFLDDLYIMETEEIINRPHDIMLLLEFSNLLLKNYNLRTNFKFEEKIQQYKNNFKDSTLNDKNQANQEIIQQN